MLVHWVLKCLGSLCDGNNLAHDFPCICIIEDDDSDGSVHVDGSSEDEDEEEEDETSTVDMNTEDQDGDLIIDLDGDDGDDHQSDDDGAFPLIGGDDVDDQSMPSNSENNHQVYHNEILDESKLVLEAVRHCQKHMRALKVAVNDMKTSIRRGSSDFDEIVEGFSTSVTDGRKPNNQLLIMDDEECPVMAATCVLANAQNKKQYMSSKEIRRNIVKRNIVKKKLPRKAGHQPTMNAQMMSQIYHREAQLHKGGTVVCAVEQPINVVVLVIG
jgi:hypothetical protein